ncbi:limulus clotting factor C-like isoform X2 [Polistes fuscatus]|uniref:limulus clotting factor C-like isoform X2 n=1 Tax=Polistes fuscatus TaxID=30207 RepID=UPI001CA87F14|nr:limulus clotting factor C-like isoform X2 [Polistes fuscatus]
MDIVKRKGLLSIAFGYFLVFIFASSVTVQENVCTVPPQPANGFRQLYKLQCLPQQSNCDLQEGTKLPALSHLIYSCNSGYQLNSSGDVFCDSEGNWTNIPVCIETETPIQRTEVIGGYLSTLSKVPWHATLYKEKISNGSKHFVCGATIIKEKFLLTAAHCIYDEIYRRIENPNKYYIATGNIYRDYDSDVHDESFVKKTRVKGIYVPCNYVGYEGNYANDIAILEIERPFVLSSSLKSACLNGDLIESGLGVTSGFGRTAEGPTSFVLQSVSLPYVPLSECKSSKDFLESENLITMDKFCAGYTNGTSVCDGDSGGGLVFRTGNLWCLRDIIYRLETSQPLPTCDSTMTNTTSTNPA